MGFWSFRPYVPVAKRREQAAREAAKLKKLGRAVAPVVVEGRKIAHSFWGKAWCENLERYSDFENRLPRGRSYVRNGSIVDLQIGRGSLRALVSGSEIYEVNIDILVAAPSRWKAICKDCAGSVGSLVELLQGKLSKNVMERVCRQGDGLFPSPREIKMSCSCPDWADMCKHVAATLYGVGARLDAAPDLLFTLRGVDRAQLISTAGADLPVARKQVASTRVLAGDDVGALFGIDITPALVPSPATATKRGSPGKDCAPDQRSLPANRRRTKKSAPSPSGETKKAAGKDEVESSPGKAASTAARQRKTQRGTKSAKATRKATEKKAAPVAGKAAGNKASAPEPPSEKPKAKTRARAGAPAGRTKAAKWIGAKARKASQRRSENNFPRSAVYDSLSAVSCGDAT
jgi:uncharacterized Zn finger protein